MPTLSDATRQSYYDWAQQGRLFTAFASVTSPVIYSTAAGTGGPLLWNNSVNTAASQNRVNAVILGVSVVVTTASGVASALGLTGATGQTAAPSSTSAITASGPGYINGTITPVCNVYSVGTPTNAGTFFFPTHTLDTGAVTVNNAGPAWVDVGGAIVVPPGSWCSVAAVATATSAVCKIGLMWVEIPI